MKTFNYSILKNVKYDNELISYLTMIHESRAQQEFNLKQRPLKFQSLCEIAKIRSTESSNAIEGIQTTSSRLKKIATNNAEPKNRSEEEIAGYRDVLDLINENYDNISITPNYILQLHKILFKYSSKTIGGTFKNVQNYITETDENNNKRIIFTPLEPFATKDAINSICEQYNMAIADGEIDPLILIPLFIHDFLCIHPFLDGNGRMSRLLTTLLLYKSGYIVGKYISLEDKIKASKNIYYLSLEQSQYGWHDNSEDCTPFIKYLLGTIAAAYREFEDRAILMDISTKAFEIVQHAVNNYIVGKFTKQNIIELCPHLSSSSIEASLKLLARFGIIAKHDVGKNTYYTRLV